MRGRVIYKVRGNKEEVVKMMEGVVEKVRGNKGIVIRLSRGREGEVRGSEGRGCEEELVKGN